MCGKYDIGNDMYINICQNLNSDKVLLQKNVYYIFSPMKIHYGTKKLSTAEFFEFFSSQKK